MQKVEPIPAFAGIKPVQALDRRGCRGDQVRIRPVGLGWTVDRVRQKRIMHRPAGAGQMVNLQPFDHLVDVRHVVQQDRHGDQRAQVRRDAPCKIKARQRFRWHRPGDDGVDDGAGKVDRHQGTDKAQDHQRNRPCPGCAHQRQGQRDYSKRHAANCRKIPRQPDLPHPAHDSHADRRAKSDRSLQRHPPLTDQPMTGITHVVGASSFGQSKAGLGHSAFRQDRPPRQTLNRGPVAVARGEIHQAIVRIPAQADVDQADLFEEIGPVHLGHQTHRGDDVAHRHV